MLVTRQLCALGQQHWGVSGSDIQSYSFIRRLLIEHLPRAEHCIVLVPGYSSESDRCM